MFSVTLYRLSEAKTHAGRGAEAQLTIASPRIGFLKTSEELDARTDLRLVQSSRAAAKPAELYGKVMENHSSQRGWLIRFTSPLSDW